MTVERQEQSSCDSQTKLLNWKIACVFNTLSSLAQFNGNSRHAASNISKTHLNISIKILISQKESLTAAIYLQIHFFGSIFKYLCICVSAHKLNVRTITRISVLDLVKVMDNMGNISWLICMRLIELSMAHTYLHAKHRSQSFSSGATLHTIKHPLRSVKHVKTSST